MNQQTSKQTSRALKSNRDRRKEETIPEPEIRIPSKEEIRRNVDRLIAASEARKKGMYQIAALAGLDIENNQLPKPVKKAVPPHICKIRHYTTVDSFGNTVCVEERT